MSSRFSAMFLGKDGSWDREALALHFAAHAIGPSFDAHKLPPGEIDQTGRGLFAISCGHAVQVGREMANEFCSYHPKKTEG